jgi:hypothetical protein
MARTAVQPTRNRRRHRRPGGGPFHPHLVELLGLAWLVQPHGRPTAGQFPRRDVIGPARRGVQHPPGPVEAGALGREAVRLGAHHDALHQHLAGQLLRELRP